MKKNSANKKIIFLLSFAFIFLSGCKYQTSVTPDRPNIIFIMSDDHAITAISCYGNSINQTPNIDRLANEGIRFNQSFCTNAICAPSRAVILTGKYSHINGHINNSLSFEGNQQTFPKILQENDYQTALVGKWHLRSEPTGFDFWSILPGQGSYYNPDFIEMGEKKRFEGYVTNLITDFSLNWLDNRDTTKPFCLLMQHKAPHRTWMPDKDHLNKFDSADIPIPETYFDDYKTRSEAVKSQKMSVWKDMYLGYDLKLTNALDSTEILQDVRNPEFSRMNENQRNEWDLAYTQRNNEYHRNTPTGQDLAIWKYKRYMQDYLATIESVDESLGKVMKYLEENDLSENTIVVYTSDQGFYLGEHGWFDKRFMYEESLKTPLIIHYPKEINKRTVSDAMVLNLDFAPTFLDYAGIEIPEDIQGESFRSILEGEKPTNWRNEIYYHYYEYPKGGHDVKRHYGIRTDNFKLIHYYYDIDEWELFDLQKDPNEMNNVYDEPYYNNIVLELKERLHKLRIKYKDDNQNDFLPGPSYVLFNHKASGSEVFLENPFSPKYSGGGSNALTDGNISGNDLSQIEDFNTWQGFERKDLVATIKLKEKTIIDSICVGFLQNINAWIFSPEWVEFSISNDNKTFYSVGKIGRPIDVQSGEERRILYTLRKLEEKTKYIRVHAKNIGVCPDWHKASGEKAWLFADEIIIN